MEAQVTAMIEAHKHIHGKLIGGILNYNPFINNYLIFFSKSCAFDEIIASLCPCKPYSIESFSNNIAKITR